MKKLLRTLCATVLLVLPLSCEFQDNPSQVAGDIVQSFGNSCSSYGPWSQAAQVHTDSLVKIFQKLKDSDQCKSLGTFLETLHQTTAQIHNSYSNDDYLAYRQLQEELQDLTLALGHSSDPDIISELKMQILSHQVALSGARAKRNLNNTRQDRVGYQDQYSQITANLGSQFSTLFSQTSDLSSCLQQSPSSVLTLFTGLAGAAGSFASPILGSKMQILSNMLNTFLGFLRNSKIDEAIWALYDSQMAQAMTCGLESMTNFYCQANDAATLVLSQANSYDKTNTPDHEFWFGVDLITRKLPVLNNWLNKVKGGVTPQNPSDAERMKVVREKKLILDTRSLEVQGAINEAISKVSKTTDPNTIKDIKVATILTIAELLSGNKNTYSYKDPFHTFQDYFTYICWLVTGPTDQCVPRESDTEGSRDYINRLGPLPSLNMILSQNWPDIKDRVERLVNIEFNDIIFINPTLLIAEAHEYNVRKTSPKEVLEKLKKFTEKLLTNSQEKHPHRIKTLTHFIDIMEQAVEIIDNSHYFALLKDPVQQDPPCDPKDPKCKKPVPLNPLIQIYELFRLEFGTQYTGEQIVTFVNWDLLDRLEDDNVPDKVDDIIREANGEIIHRLVASGTQDLFSIKRDLDSAMIQSVQNFTVFRDFMTQNNRLEKVVTNLKEKSDQYEQEDDGPYRTYGQALGHLCTLIFTTGEDWPSRKTKEICHQATLYSVYPDPENHYRIQVNTLRDKINEYKKPQERFKARICVYYKFLRSQRLYEVVHKSHLFGEPINPLYQGNPSKLDSYTWLENLVY